LKECSKSITRRLHDPAFHRQYFVGRGLDIGGKPDPLLLYSELFPLMEDVRTWDIEDGDAQYLMELPDDSFDFVHSSHCLEHLVDPIEGMRNWLRVVKPGGHLIVTVPDEDLYEQREFPSTYNSDHKWTFTIHKTSSWSPRSLNVFDVIMQMGPSAEPVRVMLLESTYRFSLPRYDQTLTPIAECGIELVLRKRTEEECVYGGRLRVDAQQPRRELRKHFNQYRDDLKTLKSANVGRPPFGNDDDL
jgi:SAM-dependent methyltransferase